jgi:RNA polymerase sigma factor for flagellar operon FliA
MTPAQQQLVTSHLRLVQNIAGYEARRLPRWIEMDEILAAGYLGLCQAADRFDPRHGKTFANWASLRIHGAIIDNFQGPRYPRRYVQMPGEWLGEEPDTFVMRDRRKRSRIDPVPDLPEILIDRSSVLDELIDREQCVVVCIDAGRARKTLTRTEGAVIDGHIGGRSLTQIAAKRRIPRSRVHKLLLVAKRKMRTELEREDKAA